MALLENGIYTHCKAFWECQTDDGGVRAVMVQGVAIAINNDIATILQTTGKTTRFHVSNNNFKFSGQSPNNVPIAWNASKS